MEREKRMNYYNEFDPKAAAWLRALIAAKLIPEGTVDERSITEVQPADLVGYTQCHFFAGIGGWPLALRLAGWPEDREVWTGSCPCQPFSNAGKRKGTKDERHLWPEFYRLIGASRPANLFGEQVGSKLGREWNVGVYADLEEIDYTVPKDENGNYELYDLPAACVGQANHPAVEEAREWAYEMAAMLEYHDPERSQLLRDFADYLGGIIVGAPHIRQRLWWMAQSCSGRLEGGGVSEGRGPEGEGTANESRAAGRVAHGSGDRGAQHGEESGRWSGKGPLDASECDGLIDGLADSRSDGRGTWRREDGKHDRHQLAAGSSSIRMANSEGLQQRGPKEPRDGSSEAQGTGAVGGSSAGRSSCTCGLGDCTCHNERGTRQLEQGIGGETRGPSATGGLAVANGRDTSNRDEQRSGKQRQQQKDSGSDFALGLANGSGQQQTIEAGHPSSITHWSDFYLQPCRDGKARRVKSGVRCLAHGIPGRVAQLRGLGNAIVPQVAAEFIKAYLEATTPSRERLSD